MKKLEIPLKFSQEDTVYTIKQIKKDIVCPMCQGEKNIVYNGEKCKCPKCKGLGVLKGEDIVNIVCEEPYKIQSINIKINRSNQIKIKYKGKCGNKKLNRNEEDLFLTVKQAEKRCRYLNMKDKKVLVKDIIITDAFKQSKPSPSKIYNKIEYYKQNGKFNSDIILNSNNILIDGYINYLIARMFNIESIVTLIDEQDSRQTFSQMVERIEKESYDSFSYTRDDNQDIEELKPCPLCGGEAHIIREDFNDGSVRYECECSICHYSRTVNYETSKRAIMAWNVR